MRVVCVGDCGIDYYLPDSRTVAGGITANFARHAVREFEQDDEVHIVSCIGNDPAGTFVLAALEDCGLVLDIETLKGITPVQTIDIDEQGEKHFVHYEAGVLNEFRFSSSQRERIVNCDLLVAPVYLQIVGLFDTLMTIRTKGRRAIDFADFLQHPDFDLLLRHIEKVDIGFFGLTSADTETMEQVRELAARFDKLFVVTLGADGSVAFLGDQRLDCDAVTVDDVIDTTGAGDAYAAAFLASYLRDDDVARAMVRGADLASKIIVQMGSSLSETPA